MKYEHIKRETLVDRLIALIITWPETRLDAYIEANQLNPLEFEDIYRKREYVVNHEGDWATNTHSNQDIIDIHPEVLNK